MEINPFVCTLLGCLAEETLCKKKPMCQADQILHQDSWQVLAACTYDKEQNRHAMVLGDPPAHAATQIQCYTKPVSRAEPCHAGFEELNTTRTEKEES